MLNETYIDSRREFIRSRRLELGKTLEDIGREVGVSKGTVQRWESGNISNMRRDKIAKLAAALEISPTQLIGYEDTHDPLPSATLDPQEAELIRTYRKLNPLGQEEALQYIHHLADRDIFKKEGPAPGSLPAAE